MAGENVLVTSEKTIQLPKGLKVLIVDPDPASRFRLKSTLRGMDSIDSVSEMSSAMGLSEFVGQRAVNVIMIDQFPGEDDVFEVVENIRGQPNGAKIRWVMVAEQLDQEAIERGKEVGIRGFLPKPFDMRSLEKALVSAVGARQDPKAKQAQDHLRDTLKKLRLVSLFSGFTDQELVRLLKICKTTNYPSGAYVFHEGEPGYNLYVVVTGQIDIKKAIEGNVRTLVSMGSGDCFGEMAIISAEPRFADAVAASDCTLIEVNEAVVNSNEDMLSLKLVRQIAILLARKLRTR